MTETGQSWDDQDNTGVCCCMHYESEHDGDGCTVRYEAVHPPAWCACDMYEPALPAWWAVGVARRGDAWKRGERE